MARPEHFGDCSAKWKRYAGFLFKELGMKVPYDALTAIRHLRDHNSGFSRRTGGAGNTEWKTIVKILLAIRDGLPWQWAYGRKIEYIKKASQGGRDTLANIRLSEY
jgi:hypothetical protein